MDEPVVGESLQPPPKYCVYCANFQLQRKDGVLEDTRQGTCHAPEFPQNLIDGQRYFPVFVARGYESLCGPSGRLWQPGYR